MTVELAGDPILVVRRDDGRLGAFHNVCRHRGSIVELAPSGRANRFVCPYHQWAYGPDGSLRAAPGTTVDFRPERFPLVGVRVAEAAGLVFVAIGDAPSFEPAGRALEAAGPAPGRARVAHRIVSEVAADWKLIWENNRECLHCAANHPQYVRANSDR